jgi:hypothetical protein
VKALASIVLALALASPATAATVARTDPEAGPVLAGPEVLWGSAGSDGSLRVMAGAPGRPPRIVHRIAGSPDRMTSRELSDLEASSQAYAFLVRTFTHGPRRSNSIGESAHAAFAGQPSGGAALIAGSMPDRARDSCGVQPQAVAVDGARVAVAAANECERRGRLSIAIHEHGARRVVEAGAGRDVGELALAGRYVAWSDRDGRVLRVYDLDAGHEVRRLRARDAGGAFFTAFDVDAGGAVAFGLANRRGASLGALVPGRPGVVTLDRDVPLYGGVAVAGGRVLHVRIPARRDRIDVALRPLAGGPPRTLRRFRTPGIVGSVDLDAARATWSWSRGRVGSGRIFVREL